MSGGHTGFAATLREASDEAWREILAHPFVRGLGDGTLAAARFRTWLAQDYGYLLDYARAMALGAAAASDVEGLRFFAAQLTLTLEEEMALHRRTCAAFGLDERTLLATEPDPVAVGYGRHLLEVGRRGKEADLVAALLPCAAGYVEIAQHLAARGLPDVPAYRDWIETYTSPAMRALATWLTRRLDAAAQDADATDRHRWRQDYAASTDWEARFFQMAWDERGAPPCGEAR